MSSPSRSAIRPRRREPARAAVILLAAAVSLGALAPLVPTAAVASLPDHLLISEVVTGGGSASDELIELHNPTDAPLPLEGLEVVYVTASGATISRRAAWPLGAPSVPARGHLLVANEAGVYAAIADALYVSGMAATGGSVAIRIQGASSAIDALGWGTAAGTWHEGAAAPAPAAGESLERLPGGASGSTRDTDDNATDFAVRASPEPQNLLSAPTPDPAASPVASPTPPIPTSTASPLPSPVTTNTPAPTAIPTAVPTPSATPSSSAGMTAVPIGDARLAADGETVTVEGVALTDSGFHDGGGFIADASGGIAVLPAGGGFARGQLVRVSGEIDDRFSQRTIRADAAAIVPLGVGADPEPAGSNTGGLGEALEGRLVRVTGAIAGSPSELSTGLAFDVDDGSGPARVVVGTATGIATDRWVRGATLTLVGVVGQRDSTGSGADGYRLLPRDPADVTALTPPASPSASPSTDPGGASPSPSDGEPPAGVVSIATARAAEHNARLRIRGVVTLATGLVDDRTAVVQDASGAIALRLGGDAGSLARGARVEVDGARSTLAGMETLRVTKAPTVLGAGTDPGAVGIATGSADEAHEAVVVSARGALVASARRSSSGTVSFEIDDGSGPLRITAAAPLGLDRGSLAAGTWVEVRGVLGQETTRARPTEGYRIWPRTADEVRVVAPATGTAGAAGDVERGAPEGGGGPSRLGDALGSGDLARLRVGATLVVGGWAELGVAGLLWDGTRLVAIDPASAPVVERLTADRHPPLALDLGGLELGAQPGVAGISVVRLGTAPADVTVLEAPPERPRAGLRGPLPAWVALVGRLTGGSDGRTLHVGDATVRLDRRCADDEPKPATDTVAVTGVAVGSPPRIVAPCGGIRPAPSLGGSVAAMPASSPMALVEAASAALDSAGTIDPRRAVAAGLVMAAAAALGAAAWFRRRATPAPEAGEAAAMADAEAPPAARLTLVRVQDEHGS